MKKFASLILSVFMCVVLALFAACTPAKTPDKDQGGTEQGGTEQGGTEQGGTEQGGTEQGGTEQGEEKPEPVENAKPVGTIYEAEEYIYASDDGLTEKDVLWGSFEETTPLRYVESSEFKSGDRIANGASVKAAANLGKSYEDVTGKFVVKLPVTAPSAGNYDIIIRSQATASKSLANVFKVNVNGEKQDGVLAYTPLAEAGNVLVANQLWNGTTFDDTTWNNMRSWTLVKLGSVTLKEGDNLVRLTSGEEAPNIDYIYLQAANAQTPAANTILDMRKTVEENGTVKEITSVTVKQNSTLGAYSSAVANTEYTGLYMRVYGLTCRHLWDSGLATYACDIAIEESMISGVDYATAGTYQATVTYINSEATYTAALQVVVEESGQAVTPGGGDEKPEAFVSPIFEAEEIIYKSSDGKAETEDLWDSLEQTTKVRYENTDPATEGTFVSGAVIANGASGKACANFGSGSNFVAKMTVNVPSAGDYDIMMRAQATESLSLANIFGVNINGEELEGALVYTPLVEAGKVLVANQLWNGTAFDETTWENMRSWSIVKLGKVTLTEGENTIRLNGGNKTPNIDYFYLQTADTAIPEENSIISLRNESASLNGTEQAVTTVTVKKDSALGAYSASVDTQVGYTGLYMRIYGLSCRHPWYGTQTVYAGDIAIDESMISGVDYTTAGTYQATVTYTNSEGTYTATLQVVVEE